MANSEINALVELAAVPADVDVFAIDDLTAPTTTKKLTFARFRTGTYSFSNKTIDLGDNTLTGSTAEFNTALQADTFAFQSDNLSVFAATTSLQLLGLISDETGSGLLVFNDTPTIITPTIVSLTNMQHSHLNAAGGGTITAAAISDLDTSTVTFSNKTIDGDVNTIVDINETQMNVSVGAATTVLTSNGVGSAPSYAAPAGGEFTGAWTANHNQTGSTFALEDALFADPTDDTKHMQMDLSGMTASRTLTISTSQSSNQTLTIPNTIGADDFVLEDFTQTLIIINVACQTHIC